MLNPTLNDLLERRFGSVRVVNEDEPLSGCYKTDPDSGRAVLEISSRGESHCVNCPYCNDTRQRLYINHRYGVEDPVTGYTNKYLVHCFNEDCFKKPSTVDRYDELYEKVFSFNNLVGRNARINIAVKPTKFVSLQPCSPPGEVISLLELDPNHPVRCYLESRGYDSQKAAVDWNLMYCLSGSERYRITSNRIIVPIIMNSMWVGWQARYVGDLDWKQTSIPKYYTLPELPKRLVLYNYDVVKNNKFVIVTEGVTAAWSVWPYGCALLGKTASVQQQKLIGDMGITKPILLMLDPDATKDAEKLEKQLRRFAKHGIATIKLPDGDPGDYQTKQDELWQIIAEQAGNQRIKSISR